MRSKCVEVSCNRRRASIVSHIFIQSTLLPFIHRLSSSKPVVLKRQHCLHRLGLGSSTLCRHSQCCHLSSRVNFVLGSPGPLFERSIHTDGEPSSCSLSLRWPGHCLVPDSRSSFPRMAQVTPISVLLRSLSSCSRHSTRRVRVQSRTPTLLRSSHCPTVVRWQI